jgi:hypothetical protein
MTGGVSRKQGDTSRRMPALCRIISIVHFYPNPDLFFRLLPVDFGRAILGGDSGAVQASERVCHRAPRYVHDPVC